MGHSLMIVGCLMGMDVRICGPKKLWPADEFIAIARELEKKYGAKLTITDDPKAAVKGVDFIHTDVWVSMGEPKEVWKERIKLLTPYQVNAELMKASGNPQVKFMHCLPAFHDTETTLGKQIAETYGISDGLEVTDEVFEMRMERRLRAGREPACTRSRRSSSPRWGTEPCWSSPRSAAMHCCERGEPMTAENQRENVRIAAQVAGAGRRASIELVVGHGNGPAGRPAGAAGCGLRARSRPIRSTCSAPRPKA